MKTCSRCHQELPATSVFFNRKADTRDGLCLLCRDCCRTANAAYRSKNRERALATGRKYRAEHREELRLYHVAHNLAFHEKRAAQRAEWQRRNPSYGAERYRVERDLILAQNREWMAAHRDERRAYHAAYELSHREERRAKNLAYRRAHPDVSAAHKRNRAARLANAAGTHTAVDVALQMARQKSRCYWCGEKVGDRYHVDHVFPISRGGSNGPDNLVIACVPCNLHKSAKFPHEFSERLC